jgi:hypothetical protein
MCVRFKGGRTCVAGKEQIMTLSRITEELKLKKGISDCISVAEISRASVVQTQTENILFC